MSYTGKCKWCGRPFDKAALLSIKSAVQGERKNYCSNKCFAEAQGSGGGGGSASSEVSAENNAELARIQWEKEQAEKQEAAEKKAKREAKAAVLKEQGKPFMAFVTVNQEGIGIGVLFTLVMVLPMAFIMGGTVIGIISSVVIGGVLVFGIYKYLKELFKK